MMKTTPVIKIKLFLMRMKKFLKVLQFILMLQICCKLAKSLLLKTHLSTLMVSLCAIWFYCLFHVRFFISHGFTNFQWIFFQTHTFLRKQTRQHNLLSNKIQNVLLHTRKKINNFVTFDSETSTKSCPGNGCPVNYQSFYEKNPSNINLIKCFF